MEEFRHLSGLTNLDIMGMTDLPLPEGELRHLPVFPKVHLISLVDYRKPPLATILTDNGFQELARAYPNLTRLFLRGRRVDATTISTSLRRFHKLDEISLNGEQCTETMMKELGKVPTLRRIDLEADIPAPIPLHFAPQIRSLYLNGAKCLYDLPTRGLLAEDHPQVEYLYLQGCHSQQGIRGFFKNLPKVKTIAMDNLPSFQAEDITALAQMPELRTLEIHGDAKPILPFLAELREKSPKLQIKGPGIPAAPRTP